MTLLELDNYFRSILPFDLFEKSDASLNGIQVGNDGMEVGNAIFCVDACMQSIQAAEKVKADCLVVHHGLFWGSPLAIRGPHYKRVRSLLENNIGLYAVHLPLDAHPELGNNAAVMEKLGVSEQVEFGRYKNTTIGWQGKLQIPMTMEDAAVKLGLSRSDCLAYLPFGPEKIETVAVISGGATKEIGQAIDAGVDLYITGEASHTMYHTALEGEINVIAGGHYNTETWGIQKLAVKCSADTGIETEFIDLPSGL